MKTIVLRNFGPPEVLKVENTDVPLVGGGQLLVKVIAAGVNPIDLKLRSGSALQYALPAVLGLDVSGAVAAVGPDAKGFRIGDLVFGKTTRTYAEYCTILAANAAKIPDELDTQQAAALPVVTLTGSQLITHGTQVRAGQTVLITGAVGNVGRTAMFVAKQRGATVVAAVRASQRDEAIALGADHVVSTESPEELTTLKPVDAIADTLGGAIVNMLLARVRPGGLFASVLGGPSDARLFPQLRFVSVVSEPDPATLLELAQAVAQRRLTIPLGQTFALDEAAAAHTLAERGTAGKILLSA